MQIYKTCRLMSWDIRLIASSFLGITVLGLPQQPNQLEPKTLTSPGSIIIPLEASDVWVSYVNIGSPGNYTPFSWDSLNTDIITAPNYYTYNTSLSFVPTGHNGTITLLDFSLQPFIATGPLAYERFNFSSVSLYGQGFLPATETPPLNATFLGFNLGQDDCTNNEAGFPTLINALWQQALIPNRVISFTYLLNMLSIKAGNVTIGTLPEGISPEALTNYTVDIDNGDWAFSLTDMQWGDLSLGFNGYLTISTICPFSVVPMPVFTTLVSLLGIPPAGFGDLEGVIYIAYNQTLVPDLSTLPDITIYLLHQPLVITPYQYLACGLSTEVCILTFSGADDVYPYREAFTLGALTFNATYSVFDFEQKTFGTALIDFN